MSETIYGRLGGADTTPETDAYPTGSIEALIRASRNHNGMSVGMPKIHVDSGWIEHLLIRSRKLERARDAARKELAEFSSFGTVEVMVRNKQVNEFIRNLESRAEEAERDYANCQAALKDERYCHGETVASLKRIESESIKAANARAEAAEKLLREIEEAAQLPDDPSPGVMVWRMDYDKLRTHALHLAAENLKLLEDVERLDWLDSWGCEYNDLLRNAWCLPFPPGMKSTTRNIRDAIDAARKAKEGK